MVGTSFYRGERWVTLEYFSNKEVTDYLTDTLNTEKERFTVTGKPKFCGGILAEFDGVSFIIYAMQTYIELTFAKKNLDKMSEVIEKLTKWSSFSKTETTFYVEKAIDDSYTVIFENGYASCGDYRRYFHDDNLKITKFKVD